MDFVVILALVVGAAICFLPGIMAWCYYFGDGKRTGSKRKAIKLTKPVTAGNA